MNRMLLGPGLLAATGSEHKKQRKLLSPAFSAAHVRGLAPVFYAIAGKVRSDSVVHVCSSDPSNPLVSAEDSDRALRQGRPEGPGRPGVDGTHRAGARRAGHDGVLL